MRKPQTYEICGRKPVFPYDTATDKRRSWSRDIGFLEENLSRRCATLRPDLPHFLVFDLMAGHPISSFQTITKRETRPFAAERP